MLVFRAQLTKACSLLGYGPFTLLGSGFDKCFLPVDSILVTDTKILYSNLNLVKSSHTVKFRKSAHPCKPPQIQAPLTGNAKNSPLIRPSKYKPLGACTWKIAHK